MKRKLASALLGLVLGFGMSTTTTATTIQAAARPTVDLAVSRPCNNDPLLHAWNGQDYYSSTHNLSAASAEWLVEGSTSAPDDDFSPCFQGICFDFDGCDGASVWTAIVPGTGNPARYDPWAIAQIGIITCNNGNNFVCVRAPKFFYAYGGCGHPPVASLLGGVPNVADHTFYTFEVRNHTISPGNVEFEFRINNTVYADVNWTDSALSCWAPGFKAAQFLTETWDRADWVGGTSLYPDWLQMRSPSVKYDGSWHPQVTVCEVNSWPAPNSPYPQGCQALLDPNGRYYSRFWNHSN